jgi:hypothetical protein
MTVVSLTRSITNAEFVEWIAYYYDEAERDAEAAKEAKRKH